jgi:putative colanic acid biosynthesis UDP-glucose lipid carrier transferase
MDSATATKEKIEFYDIETYKPLKSSSLNGFAVIDVRRSPMGYKQAFDFITSLALIIGLFSWMFPIIYILIKLSSKGPVLFVQKRAGLQGKIFNCYKFRTMYLNNGADSVGAIPNDDRITPIGKWLRKTCLDELPQVFNVLKGEMSIVGPRPHMMMHHYQFSSLLPSYQHRHDVKPGITGLSQIRGFHGAIMDFHCIYGRTKIDLFYIRKANLWLDIYILFRTISVVLGPKNLKHGSI